MLKKFINQPNDVVDEMLEGFLAAHGDIVKKLETSRVQLYMELQMKM